MSSTKDIGYTIRPATIEDEQLLMRHRRLMWWDMGRRDEAALDLMDKAATEYFSKALADGSYRGFLAIDPSAAVVGGGGIVISEWPGIFGQVRAERAMILNVYVEPEHRRRGVARLLMETMIAWCRANGFANVALHASDEGRPLYESLGFKPTNEMRLDLSPAQ
jgi:GNAT superfamily N-acetyltransferase